MANNTVQPIPNDQQFRMFVSQLSQRVDELSLIIDAVLKIVIREQPEMADRLLTLLPAGDTVEGLKDAAERIRSIVRELKLHS
jgi:uncharacterized protein with PhoU and TrkA domain